MLTISTSQSLREKQALGDSADSARITDPEKGKALCVCVCVCGHKEAEIVCFD